MIRDSAGNPISSYIGTIDPEEVKTCTVKIDCAENTSLRSSVVGPIAVEARKSGDVSWINIETTPIDLTPYAPALTTFEIRLTATDIIEGRNAFSITVGP